MRQRITSGETIFCALEPSLWDMRQAAKMALLDDAPMKRFIVMDEVHYYADAMERLFLEPEVSMENALNLGDKIVGKKNGALKCVALWSMNSWSGVLLHREGNKLLYAYIPLLTKETAEREHTISLMLSKLAKDVGDAPIRLETAISIGQYRLSDLLELLSEAMDV